MGQGSHGSVPKSEIDTSMEIDRSLLKIDYPSPRDERAIKRAVKKSHEKTKGKYSKHELSRAYEAYKFEVADQRKIDLESLAYLFERCPGIEDVTLAFCDRPRGWLDAPRLAFKDALVSPLGDADWEAQGKWQLQAMSAALQRSKRSLRALTLYDMSHRILDPSYDFGWKNLMQCLKEFRCTIRTPESAPLTEEAMMVETASLIRQDGFFEVVGAAPELRVLKLALAWGYEGRDDELPLSGIVKDFTWHKLYEFGISHIEADEDDLVDFLQRHRSTLRRVSLSYIRLGAGSWRSLFERISETMPKLRKIKLCGYLTSDDNGEDLDFEDPAGRRYRSHKVRDAVERYILSGGEYPELDPIDSDSWIESDDEEDDPYYKPPELDHDGYTSEGSAVSYSSDWLDASI